MPGARRGLCGGVCSGAAAAWWLSDMRAATAGLSGGGSSASDSGELPPSSLDSATRSSGRGGAMVWLCARPAGGGRGLREGAGCPLRCIWRLLRVAAGVPLALIRPPRSSTMPRCRLWGGRRASASFRSTASVWCVLVEGGARMPWWRPGWW